MLNACAAVWDKLPEDKVADRFLHHPDQRFRLSYLLGSWRKNMPAEPAADEWDFGEANQAATAAASSDETVSSADAEALQARLVDYVGRITGLAASKAEAISKELLPDRTRQAPKTVRQLLKSSRANCSLTNGCTKSSTT